jgi:peptide/nickel transport system substrate-binding protein
MGVVAMLATACAPPPTRSTDDRAGATSPRPTAIKRVTAVMSGDPHTLYQKLNSNNAVRGIVAVEPLVNSGLVIEPEGMALVAQLAEAVPTLENGLWQVFPDGRMETTWKIRPTAQWHDGRAFTSADLQFTAQVVQDPELPSLSHIATKAMAAVEAPDPHTITVKWHKPYVQADSLFSAAIALPLPKHLLERVYTDEKTTLLDHPYWSQEFVGTGPFRLREWHVGSHLVLEANDQYVLGRPRIDEIEVRFILDSNAIMANILAGAVDLTLDRTLSVEQAIQIRDSWDGTLIADSVQSGMNLWPQLLNPSPAVVGDVRFRRALLHAIDRQQLVDVLMAGLSQVTHSWIPPTDPRYREVEHLIVKYDYDPRRATQMIEGLGYTRAGDGFFHDASGQRLAVEARTISLDVNQKSLLAVADFWQRVGVTVDPVVVPTARQSDREYRATFPGFDLLRGAAKIEQMDWLHSDGARLPENDFRGRGGSTNYPRYMSSELDALIERLFSTIPPRERMQVAGQVAHHMTDQLLVLPLFYDSVPVLASKRLQGVPSGKPWNAETWEVR